MRKLRKEDLDILREDLPILLPLSSSFYSLYKKEAKEHGLSPKSSRAFSNYVNELIELGYLKVERAKARGNVRAFKATLLSRVTTYGS